MSENSGCPISSWWQGIREADELKNPGYVVAACGEAWEVEIYGGFREKALRSLLAR